LPDARAAVPAPEIVLAIVNQHQVRPEPAHSVLDRGAGGTFLAVTMQIVALDAVFSVDSILTAVGMTEHLPIMYAAVILAVAVMFLAAGPVTRFVNDNPTVVMLALAFLLMIGMVLIAEGFGVHVPKGYIYAAMAFAALVEGLNMARRRNLAAARARHGGEGGGGAGDHTGG